MNEEYFLKSHVGKERPFKVPENYFKDFTRQMMDNLPQRETSRKPKRITSITVALHPLAAAACLCIAIFSALVFFTNNSSNDGQVASSGFQYTPESNMDQMLEYAMLDNEDFYNYVFEEQL